MRNKAKLPLLTVCVLCLTLVLAACSGNNSDQSSGETDNNSSGDVQGKPLIVVPEPKGDYDKNFNPFQPNALSGTNGLLYEPLAYLDPVGGDIHNFLAKDEKWSDDNKTLTVTLHDDAKWSDGEDFSVDDVVFTFNYMKEHDETDLDGLWEKLSSVEKKGDNEVAFTFKKPNVPFQRYVLGTDIVPKHIWKDIDDPTKEQVDDPVGTGPYTLDSFSSSVYSFKAKADYYKGEYPVPEVKYPSYDGNESVTLGLAKGDIDWGGIFINKADKVYEAKNEDNHYWFPTKNNFAVYTNLKKPLISDKAVRKAMSLAIDRKKVSEQAESGFAPPAKPTFHVDKDEDWVNPDWTEKEKSYKHDPDKAMQVLEDAGYKKNGKGTYEKDGKPLSFSLITVSGWTDWADMTKIVQQNLGDIGIDIEVKQIQQGTYMDNVQNGDFELAISYTNEGFTPYTEYKDFLSSNGSWNLEQFESSEADKALADFAATTDEQEQKEAIFKLQKIAAEEIPSIALVQGPVWYEYNTSKYTGWPTEDDPYVDPAPHDWPAPSIVLKHLKPVQ